MIAAMITPITIPNPALVRRNAVGIAALMCRPILRIVVTAAADAHQAIFAARVAARIFPATRIIVARVATNVINHLTCRPSAAG